MSGAGNTFIVLDGKHMPQEIALPEFARHACEGSHEHEGADGLIIVLNSADYDFEMKYYNRDGSYGMMCGNGGRCAVRYAAEHGYVQKNNDVSFINAGIPYKASLTERGVNIDFPDAKEIRLDQKILINNNELTYAFVDVGTPHVIIFVGNSSEVLPGNINDIDVAGWGAAVRNHPDFVKQGVNVNFTSLLPSKEGIQLRTYERGVEAETGACGTGAIATAIVAGLRHDLSHPVNVIPTSGSPLWIDFTVSATGKAQNISLEGEADILMHGTLHIPEHTFSQP